MAEKRIEYFNHLSDTNRAWQMCRSAGIVRREPVEERGTRFFGLGNRNACRHHTEDPVGFVKVEADGNRPDTLLAGSCFHAKNIHPSNQAPKKPKCLPDQASIGFSYSLTHSAVTSAVKNLNTGWGALNRKRVDNVKNLEVREAAWI